MSGWIKIEKDLESDPRVLRMAKNISRLFSCNAPALPGVTLVCGALTRLWIYADSHIREDDTLDLGAAEIDEWLGVPGFCAEMPDDWLREIDDRTVELPGFQAHNGVEARKKALTQKRVAHHRNKEKRKSVTPCNAAALPDQTRPDQTRPIKKVPTEPVEQSSTDDVSKVFDHWQRVYRKPKARLDDKRRAVIRKALKHYSEADLCQSISGYLNSPHHMGQNQTGTVYDDIELFLRDSKHVDAGLKFYAEPPRTDLSQKTRAIVAATESWTPPEIRHATN